MADLYVRSGGPSGAWTSVYASLDLAAGDALAGATVYVAPDHSASHATGKAITFSGGTVSNPVRVICADSTESLTPTGTATTAKEAATGTFNITGAVYMYGIQFEANTSSSPTIQYGNATTDLDSVFESCAFRLLATSGSGAYVQLGYIGTGASRSRIRLINCTFKFANAGQRILIGHQQVDIIGGGLESGTTSPTYLFNSATYGNRVTVTGFDMSAAGSSMILTNNPMGLWTFFGCKLPSGHNWSLYTGTLYPSADIRVSATGDVIAGATDPAYKFKHQFYAGAVRQSTAVYKSSGASDGTTSYSIAATTNSSAKYPTTLLRIPVIPVWNESTGSAMTATVEIVHDGASAFTDTEIWLEVAYVSDNTSGLMSRVSESAASIIATDAAQTSSAASWTGASGTGPNGSSTWNALKLQATFTPAKKGQVLGYVCVAIPSKTTYIDSKLTLA